MDHEWGERRHRELNLMDVDPTVLIIGAGHTGLGNRDGRSTEIYVSFYSCD